MHVLKEFVRWLSRSSDKAEKLEFKTQREAAEFVRRLYNQNGAPNARLKEAYRRGSDVERNGIARPSRKTN